MFFCLCFAGVDETVELHSLTVLVVTESLAILMLKMPCFQRLAHSNRNSVSFFWWTGVHLCNHDD